MSKKNKALSKRHHYVFKHYLDAWGTLNPNQIWCLSDRKIIFKNNTTNLGLVRFHNRFPSLGVHDFWIAAKIIETIALGFNYPDNFKSKATGLLDEYIQASIAHELLSASSTKYSTDVINHGFEDRYTKIENKNIKYLNALKCNDLTFWENHENRHSFINYLWNQYFRTKKNRDLIDEVIDKSIQHQKTHKIIIFKGEFNSLGLSQLICDLLELYQIELETLSKKKLILLENNTNTPFLTCDQPIVNIHASYASLNPSIDKLDLYYPLTPDLALLIIDNDRNKIISIPDDKIREYNQLIVEASHKQIYSNEKDILVKYQILD